ncbi:hypothetical protein ACNUDN_04477 [Mycobacterium sp. smrl_JER01]
MSSAQLDITPHNLRDTAASLAIQAGASVVAVARLLGHESAATTLNHYAGLFPSDLDDVAQRLDAAARRVQHADNQADDMPVDQKRRWIPADEVAEILNSSPVDDGLHEDIYGPAEPGDDGEQSGETNYLLRAPENARRLLEAVARDKASQPAPTETSEAPTKHRPEGSDQQ